MSRAGRLARSLALRFGYQIVRVPPEDARDDRFYRPPESCQIPTLADLYEVAFGRRRSGVFVEVGGFDGETHTNVGFLGDLGWRGVVVEPVPALAEMCRRRHRGNGQVDVVEVAVGSSAGRVQLHVAGSLSTANEDLLAEYHDVAWARTHVEGADAIEVEVRPLDDVLEAAGLAGPLDVVSIDVEGFEAEVFEGFDLDRWRPRVLVVELADMHPDIASTRDADRRLLRSLEERGYDVVYKDVVNTVLFDHHRR